MRDLAGIAAGPARRRPGAQGRRRPRRPAQSGVHRRDRAHARRASIATRRCSTRSPSCTARTRAGFLRTAALGSAAMLAGARRAGRRRTAQVSDVDILQLRAALRAPAGDLLHAGRGAGHDRVAWPTPSRSGRETLGAHERAHVRIIKQVLGPKAGPRPFVRLRRGQRDRCRVHAHGGGDGGPDRRAAHRHRAAGARPRLTAALLGLLTVEARHAAWARHIVGAAPAPAAFDEPQDAARRCRACVARTRFIAAAAEDDREAPADGSPADAEPRRADGSGRALALLARLAAVVASASVAGLVRATAGDAGRPVLLPCRCRSRRRSRPARPRPLGSTAPTSRYWAPVQRPVDRPRRARASARRPSSRLCAERRPRAPATWSRCSPAPGRSLGRTWVRVRTRDPAQRHDRVGAATALGGYETRCDTRLDVDLARLTGDALPQRTARSSARRSAWDVRARPTPAGSVLRPQPAHRATAAPPTGRWPSAPAPAHPRRPTGRPAASSGSTAPIVRISMPGRDLPRLHPHAQRRHPRARAADARSAPRSRSTDAGRTGAYTRPRARSIRRARTRSSLRRPSCSNSLVSHIRSPSIRAAVSSENARSTYMSSA